MPERTLLQPAATPTSVGTQPSMAPHDSGWHLDQATLWPTHRIRSFLSSQLPPAPSGD